MLQLAVRSNIHPLICVAGKAQDHVKSMIDTSKGDTIVDYRNGDEAVVQGIKDALKGQKLEYAYDAVSEKGSIKNIASVLDSKTGKSTFVLPPPGGWTGKFPELGETQQSKWRHSTWMFRIATADRFKAPRMLDPYMVHSRTLVSFIANTSRGAWRKAFSGARSKKSSQAVSAACRRASRT